jgi:hypothetical protein
MRKLLAVGLGLLLVGSAAVALAAIPDSNNVIHACRKNSDGSLRVIDTEAGQRCPNGYTPLSWRQDGLPGYQVVEQSATIPAGYAEREFGAVQVRCPSGTRPLGGGGYGPQGGGANWVLTLSSPFMAGTDAIGWNAKFLNVGSVPDNQFDATAYAICADVDGSLT